MTAVPPEPPSERPTLAGVATTLVGGLQGQPLVIGLMIINIVFIAAMFVAIREARIQEHAEMRLLLERCVPGAK